MMGTQDATTRDFSLGVLGTKMNTRSLDDALVQGGLDWTVEKVPLVGLVPGALGVGDDGEISHGEPSRVAIPGKYGVIRSTQDETIPHVALGVVGERYTQLQNRDAFGFVDQLLHLGGDELHVDFAGSMHDGRKVFLDVKLPKTISVGGFDPVDMRLLMVNTHDGTSPFTLSLHINRIPCTNAIELTKRNAKSAQQHWSLRHTSSITGRVQQARETLQLTLAAVDEFEAEAQQLIAKSITDRQFERLVEGVFPNAPLATTKAKEATAAKRLAVRSIYRGETGTQGQITGNAWGALNAFVEWADWSREVRVPKRSNIDDSTARALAQLDSRHVQVFKSNVMGRVLAMK